MGSLKAYALFAANVIAPYHSHYADDNLSEMPSGFHVPVGRAHLVKAKHAIDYRLDLVGGDGGILPYVRHVTGFRNCNDITAANGTGCRSRS